MLVACQFSAKELVPEIITAIYWNCHVYHWNCFKPGNQNVYQRELFQSCLRQKQRYQWFTFSVLAWVNTRNTNTSLSSISETTP